MGSRNYDAILLDLDGTLVDESDRIHPRTLAALRAAAEQGVRVMIATGRSELATIPVVEQLGILNPAVVFNGAAMWCPSKRRLIEERVLSERTLARLVRFGLDRGLMTVAMCEGIKYSTSPRNDAEWSALRDMTAVEYVDPARMQRLRAMRVTFFSNTHERSDDVAAELEAAVQQPMYITHFPLNCLPHHRESKLLVCDVHPPCRGKAEALRWLLDEHAIRPDRVVAVGDAGNDVPMMTEAGLGCAMGNAYPEALAVADRVLGTCDSGTIGELVEELFLGRS